MEENKPTSRRSTSSRARAPRAPKSAHIIDLRQAPTGAGPAASKPAPVAPKPKPPAVPQPEHLAPPPAKPASGPAHLEPAVKPTEPEKFKAPAPVVSPQAYPEAPASKADFIDSSLSSQKRFWPAFWRFLVLLVLLGLILTGGLYFYLNYYKG